LWAQGQQEEAGASVEEAQKLYEKLASSDPDRYQMEWIRSLGAWGAMRSGTGDHRGAMSTFQQAMSLLLPLAQKQPALHRELLSSLLRDLLSCAKAGKIKVDSEKIAEALRLV
jgi:tetratricopeptide (TPR) repeat protein